MTSKIKKVTNWRKVIFVVMLLFKLLGSKPLVTIHKNEIFNNYWHYPTNCVNDNV